MTYRSELGQDEQLNRELFQNRRGLTFVDVGAYDGVGFSNTIYFEEELGWRGICIEPHPERFERLKVNRPKSVCINAAAWSSKGTHRFLMCKAAPQHLERERQSDAKGSPGSQLEMLSCMTEVAHARRGQAHDNWLKEYGGERVEIEVQCVRLWEVFLQHKIMAVDYLTIDAEGSEHEVLKGIDFTACKINVIEFEVAYRETGDDLRETAQIYDLLRAKGFHHHCDLAGGRDRVFVSNNIKWSLDK